MDRVKWNGNYDRRMNVMHFLLNCREGWVKPKDGRHEPREAWDLDIVEWREDALDVTRSERAILQGCAFPGDVVVEVRLTLDPGSRVDDRFVGLIRKAGNAAFRAAASAVRRALG